MSTAAADAFAASRSRFDALTGWLTGDQAGGLDHAELESMLAADGRELLRQLLQDHLDLRAVREERLSGVADEAGVPRRAVETGHPRGLTTVFGAVTVTRTAYRRRGHANLHPADAALNLPAGRHSHGLRRLACVEATRGSFDDTLQAVERATGQKLAKRQAEQLVHAAAVDVDAFYASRCTPAGVREQVLALSADGKGIVMRPDSLRPATQRAAKTSRPKLGSRLSKGEKRNRKRLAEVCAVFDVTPRPRTAADIMTTTSDGDTDDPGDAATTPAPAVTNKWLKASVTADAATVIHDMFDEAERRDPDHERTWVALVDGNNHQIDRLTTEAAARGVDLAIVVDFIHALEYLWKAAWSFHDEADPAAEQWVHDKAVAVLNGHAARVAADIRRAAAERELGQRRRKGAEVCAIYLTNKNPYLDYPHALEHGWPIATGVIEGACRHLVKDRMDITGARWSLTGAEAILKLRALQCNGDLKAYWRYHLDRERHRHHETRYLHGTIPRAA